MLVKGVKKLNDLGVFSGLRWKRKTGWLRQEGAGYVGEDVESVVYKLLKRLTIMWQLHNKA
ncbi:hypothetical protein CASFOL_030994 [Castilleja foliolosa]